MTFPDSLKVMALLGALASRCPSGGVDPNPRPDAGADAAADVPTPVEVAEASAAEVPPGETNDLREAAAPETLPELPTEVGEVAPESPSDGGATDARSTAVRFRGRSDRAYLLFATGSGPGCHPESGPPYFIDTQAGPVCVPKDDVEPESEPSEEEEEEEEEAPSGDEPFTEPKNPFVVTRVTSLLVCEAGQACRPCQGDECQLGTCFAPWPSPPPGECGLMLPKGSGTFMVTRREGDRASNAGTGLPMLMMFPSTWDTELVPPPEHQTFRMAEMARPVNTNVIPGGSCGGDGTLCGLFPFTNGAQHGHWFLFGQSSFWVHSLP